ncbi:uncharacterized protein LOC133452130 [Cololabis saira]|uniref:uncharacterized protein LOC133452130 n=1 Tax=Cololabis saira TaxID=129043 RepID=UPI002AD459B3|nr:uncharacterized protein LOC133452130 [Cololabis saira]
MSPQRSSERLKASKRRGQKKPNIMFDIDEDKCDILDVIESLSEEDPSSPRSGPSSSQPGPSSPRSGPSSSQPGPSSSQPGPSSPRSGPSSPQPGPSSPRSGPSSSQPGPSSPQSGPSSPRPRPRSSRPATSKKPKRSQRLCANCRKLYRNAKRAKKPLPDKLLDTDPESLTCDQWMLVRRTRNTMLPVISWRRLSWAPLDEASVRLRQQRGAAGPSPGCDRPSVFLQRNLRQSVSVQVKNQGKRLNRKRGRSEPQSSRVAKQRRLQSSPGVSCAGDGPQRPGVSCAGDGPQRPGVSCAGDGPQRPGVSCAGDGPSSPGTRRREDPRPAEPRQVRVLRGPKKALRFQQRFRKMQGNSSIVKEAP